MEDDAESVEQLACQMVARSTEEAWGGPGAGPPESQEDLFGKVTSERRAERGERMSWEHPRRRVPGRAQQVQRS